MTVCYIDVIAFFKTVVIIVGILAEITVSIAVFVDVRLNLAFIAIATEITGFRVTVQCGYVIAFFENVAVIVGIVAEIAVSIAVFVDVGFKGTLIMVRAVITLGIVTFCCAVKVSYIKTVGTYIVMTDIAFGVAVCINMIFKGILVIVLAIVALFVVARRFAVVVTGIIAVYNALVKGANIAITVHIFVDMQLKAALIAIVAIIALFVVAIFIIIIIAMFIMVGVAGGIVAEITMFVVIFITVRRKSTLIVIVAIITFRVVAFFVAVEVCVIVAMLAFISKNSCWQHS